MNVRMIVAVAIILLGRPAQAGDVKYQDLLDAMKDKAPEAFEEQVKRYYETLVE